MAVGKIKWFSIEKGFGFIEPKNGGKLVFVHVTAAEKAGIDILKEGQEVGYDILSDRGKEAAGNLRLL
jgi:CspA family cold shock protein